MDPPWALEEHPYPNLVLHVLLTVVGIPMSLMGLISCITCILNVKRLYISGIDQASKDKDWTKLESMEGFCYLRARVFVTVMGFQCHNQFGWTCLSQAKEFTYAFMYLCITLQWAGLGVTGLTILISWYSNPYTYLCCTCGLLTNWVTMVFMIVSEAFMSS